MACKTNITMVKMITVTIVNHVSKFHARPLANVPMMCLSAAITTIKMSRTGSRMPFMTWATSMIPKRLTPGIKMTIAEITKTNVIMP